MQPHPNNVPNPDDDVYYEAVHRDSHCAATTAAAGDLLLQIWVMMLGKRAIQVSPIIPSHLQPSCIIKRINDRSGPSRRSSMGPITSDHCSPSSKPHPRGREPHQSHGNVSQMTSQNRAATGHQSLDWQHCQRGCDSSINPWRGLSTVHGSFLSKKGFLKHYYIKDHSLLPHQCKNCPSIKVKICYCSKCQVCLPINAIHYILPLMLLLSDV